MKWIRGKNMLGKGNWLYVDDRGVNVSLMGVINRFRFIYESEEDKHWQWGYSPSVFLIRGQNIDYRWEPKRWREGNKVPFNFATLEQAKEWTENTVNENVDDLNV